MPERNIVLLLKKPISWYYIVMFAFGSLYFVMAIANHYFFRSVTEDYGVYNYAFWDYSHLHIHNIPLFLVHNKMHVSLVDDHLSLTLFYFVPFYWLFNWFFGTYLLNILLVTFVLIGAWGTYRLIALKTEDNWLAVLSVLFYFLLQGHYSIFVGDFNIGVIASCLVPVFIYLFETRRFTAAFIVFILALFSKEEMPLSFLFVFPVIMLWHKNEKKIINTCIKYMAGCILYFILAFTVFMPLLHRSSLPYNLFNYSALGPNPLKALLFIFHHPLDTFTMLFENHSQNPLFNWVKEEFYMVYLVSGGFLLFLRPQYLLWFIPVLAQKMFNDVPIRWSIELHYAIEIVSLLPIAVYLILYEIEVNKKRRYFIAGMVCLLTFTVTAYKMDASTHALEWMDTTKENIFADDFFHPDYDATKIHDILKLIPPDARVSASQSILPHLSQRKYIYEFPDVEDAEYMALFTKHNFYSVSEKEYFDSLAYYICSPNWDIIAQTGPFILLRKQANHLKPSDFIFQNTNRTSLDSMVKNIFNPGLNLMATGDTIFLFAREHNQNKATVDFSCDAERLSPDSRYFILSNNKTIETGGKQTNEKAHSGNYSLKLYEENHFGMNYSINNVKGGGILLINVWRYSTKGNGVIAVSNDENFFRYGTKVVERDNKGWEKLSLVMAIPANFPKLKLYVWNNGSTPVYFDDLEVKIYGQIHDVH